MASGIFLLTRKLNADKIAIDGRIVWSSESNGTVKNSSKVTAELQLMKPNKATTTGTWTGSFTVGTKTVDVSKFLAVGGDWVTIETITTTVSHKADGTGTCYLQAKIDGPSSTSVRGSSTTGSTNVTLDTIPRFATILSATDFTDEENPTITYSNPAGSAVSRLQACISVTGEDDDIEFRDIPTSGESYTFPLTAAERNVLRAAAANSNTLLLKFVIRSTIGEVTKRNNVKATMSIVNAAPEATFSVRDTNAATIELTGDNRRLIALHSVAEVALTVTTKKGATIPNKGVEITDGTTVWKKNGSFTGEISPISSGRINYTVTDSRGNQIGGGVANTFIDYFNPEIEIASITRDGSGNLTVVAEGAVFIGSFGKVSNTRTIYYRYKKSTDESYTEWAQFSSSEVVWDGNNFTATKTISGLDYTKSYNVHVSIADRLHEYPGVIARKIGLSTIPIFDWGSEDFKFNVPVYDQTGAQIGNSETEWQNPPMLLGAQYRTTERYLGKAVYAKLVDFGALPNAGNKTVAYYGKGSTSVVDLRIMLSDGCMLSAGYGRDRGHNTSSGMYIDCTKYNVRIYTEADFSALTAYALVKYTID